MKPIMKAAAVIALLPAALAILTGAFFGSRAALGSPVPVAGVPNDQAAFLFLTSFVGGLLLFAGVASMTVRKPWAWPAAIGSLAAALALSVGVQLTAQSGVVAIGSSWIVTGVALFALAVLGLPDVRRWYAPPEGGPSGGTPR